MRTTLDIDEDVLQAAKELASRERSSAGRVISRIFRRGIQSLNRSQDTSNHPEFTIKNGIRVLASRGGELITLAHVRQLMDEEDI